MKKVLTLALGLVFAASAAIALQEPPANPPDQKKVVANDPAGVSYMGTIVTLDSGTRVLTLRDSEGKVTTYYWTETTKLPSPMIKVGDPVTIIATDQNGRMTATTITTTTTKTTTQKKY
ncbi:MAG TPA: hypothetical protein VIE39_01600 [Thermoanaerobaculia bacterium]|jgi:hypothetical protein